MTKDYLQLCGLEKESTDLGPGGQTMGDGLVGAALAAQMEPCKMEVLFAWC